jgi:ABC-type sulfate transport system permease component
MVAADHGMTSSLIGGYQVAFIAGASAIVVGIVLAFALLRPRRPALRLAEVHVERGAVAIEEQAA